MLGSFLMCALQLMIFISGSELKSQDEETRVLKTVSNLQTQSHSPVNILTYTITSQSSSDNGLGRHLACENEGLWTDVTDIEQPDLENYFSFVALPAEHAEKAPNLTYFSRPYEDEGGIGTVTTVSKAVFREFGCKDHSPGPKRQFMGCVGIDTRMGEFAPKMVEAYLKSLNKVNRNDLSIRNVNDLNCQLQVQTTTSRLSWLIMYTKVQVFFAL